MTRHRAWTTWQRVLGIGLLFWISAAATAEAQQIQVTSADPFSAPQGTGNLNVTISGTGFKRGAKASFYLAGTTNPGGVVVNSTAFSSSTKIVANISIADLATISSFDIVVKNSDGRVGKGTELFAVTAKGTPIGSIAGPIEMTISDDAAFNVHSDLRGKIAPNLYIDSTLPGGDLCADGVVNSTGYTKFYPGRKISDGVFCNASLPQSDRRTYVLKFPWADGDLNDSFPGPCQYLNLPQDADGGFCTVTANDLDFERIILNNLFAKNSGTAGQVHFSLPPGYGVITDGSAVIVADSNPGIRTAAYTGTAKLYVLNTGKGSKLYLQVSSSFALPFQIKAERVPH